MDHLLIFCAHPSYIIYSCFGVLLISTVLVNTLHNVFACHVNSFGAILVNKYKLNFSKCIYLVDADLVMYIEESLPCTIYFIFVSGFLFNLFVLQILALVLVTDLKFSSQCMKCGQTTLPNF